MKLQHEHLLKGLEFALNYHGIDAKANMADFKLAELLTPQVIHGAECAKTGADPAMTPNYKTVVAGKPADIEALAQRLAEVEDRLALWLAEVEALPSGAGTAVEDAVAVAEAEAWTAAVAQVEEPVAESEPLKPQRGDRVRLEGAIAYYGHDTIPEGWYDVLGCDAVTSSFQIKAATGALRWVEAGAGLKEVRRGAAKLPE